MCDVDLHFTREKRDCQQFFLEKKSFFFFYERAIDKLSSIRYSISCARDLYDFSKGTLTITRRSVAFKSELYGFHFVAILKLV
ncbi:hypothetical protein EZ049_13100 [Enterococcus faecalis]|nr:hypothetical protein [Enterococcus faecalis]